MINVLMNLLFIFVNLREKAGGETPVEEFPEVIVKERFTYMP